MTRASRSGRGRKISGVTLIIAGTMFYLIHLGIIASGTDITRLPSIVGAFPALGPCLTIGGLFLFWRGSQYVAKADAERILTEHKPEVLGLATLSERCFNPEVRFLDLDSGVVGLGNPGGAVGRLLRPFGDLVAIGRPG